MNYKRIYDSIVANASTHKYTEKHHIVPKSIGGTDEANNIIVLSAREHFICHYLLTKMYNKYSNKWYKMNHAFMMMKCSSANQCRYVNSKLYESLKMDFSLVMSRNQSGHNNSQHGNRWIHSESLMVSKKLSKTAPLPFGWVEGRVIKFDRSIINCKQCDIKFFPNGKRIFCSDKCKVYHRAPHYKFIDDNIEELVDEFKTTNSINKTLEARGILNRKGNTYFSKILKSRNITVMKRRNS